MAIGPQTPKSNEAESLRLLERALDYLSQNNTNFARLVLKQRKDLVGEDTDGLVYLAMTHARENDHEKALELYRKAAACGDADVGTVEDGEDLWQSEQGRPFLRALHGLAASLMELGRYEESEADVQRGEKLRPTSRNLRLTRARLLDATDPVVPNVEVDERRSVADEVDDDSDSQ